MSHATQILRLIAITALLTIISSSPAQAGQLRIDGHTSLGAHVFNVKNVKARSVSAARLVVGVKTRSLSLRTVRKQIAEGRVRVPARGATKRTRPALKLTIRGALAAQGAAKVQRPPAPSPTGALTWRPPTLSAPTTLTLNTTNNYFRLDNQKDYIVKYPSSVKAGQLMIEGGRNITIIGGAQRSYTGAGAASIYFTDNGTNGAPVNGRIIHVEGISVDMAGGDGRDIFGLQTPSAIVQLENIRAMNVHGVGSGVHADIVQNYGPVGGLRVDRMTGSTTFQGFFIRPQEGLIKNVDLRRVNLTNNPNGEDTHTQVLYFANPDGAAPPLNLDSFYVKNNRPGQNAQNAVYPDATATGMASAFDGTTVSFPTFSQVTGTVTDGNPPNGDFVTSTVAGLAYTTPGYVG